jgi:hypothetical protein
MTSPNGVCDGGHDQTKHKTNSPSIVLSAGPRRKGFFGDAANAGDMTQQDHQGRRSEPDQTATKKGSERCKFSHPISFLPNVQTSLLRLGEPLSIDDHIG